MTKLFYTWAMRKCNPNIFYNATRIDANGQPHEPNEATKMEQADSKKIDSLDLTQYGKAEMLVRLAGWQSVEKQFSMSQEERSNSTPKEAYVKMIESLLAEGRNWKSALDAFKVMTVLDGLTKAKEWAGKEEEKPEDPKFPM